MAAFIRIKNAQFAVVHSIMTKIGGDYSASNILILLQVRSFLFDLAEK
jgi:hypothetical protein